MSPGRALVLAAVIACGGGGGSREPAALEVALGDGRLAELAAQHARVTTLRADRPGDAVVAAQLAELEGLRALLYGTPITDERAFAPVAAGQPGFRAWVIGKVALELTRATRPEQLTEPAALLDELARTAETDPWRRWLVARVALVRGDRVAATEVLQGLAETHAVARTDYALVIADHDLGAAERLLAGRSHELSMLAHAMILVEQGELAAADRELAGVTADAPRIAGYRTLARAELALAGQRFERAGQLLAALGQQRALPNECWLWERIAFAHLQLGRNVERTNDHKIAGIARTRCAALGKATGDNQRLLVIDAYLQLGIGKPEVARQLAARTTSTWGRIAGAYAALELGEPRAVAPGFAGLAEPRRGTPEQRAATAVQLQAAAQLATGAPRTEALAALAALADKGGDQRARFALGGAYFAVGDLTAAKRELRRVVEETSAERPDPFGYRTHQLLAEIALATDDLPTAGPEIEQALALHPGNSYSRVLAARLQLRHGNPALALDAMAPARKLGELSAAGKLVVAEALATLPGRSAEQQQQARALVLEVKDVLPAREVGRVAALVDPKLPAQLAVPVALPKQGT